MLIDGFGGQGKPTTFIRLQGCNLKCKWCDTAQTQVQDNDKGSSMTVGEIIGQYTPLPKVTITGGEPLLQYEEVKELVHRLIALHTYITIETNGTVPIDKTFCNAIAAYRSLRIVMDYKLPSSEMEDQMDMRAFKQLAPWDVIKFVIADRIDYERMLYILDSIHSWNAQIVISPILPSLNLAEAFEAAGKLAKKMLAEPKLRHAQFNLQMHKLLGVR